MGPLGVKGGDFLSSCVSVCLCECLSVWLSVCPSSPPRQKRISTPFFVFNIFAIGGASSSTLFFKMAAMLAAIFKMADSWKTNHRILTQFFVYTIFLMVHEHSWNYFFKMAAILADISKMADGWNSWKQNIGFWRNFLHFISSWWFTSTHVISFSKWSPCW